MLNAFRIPRFGFIPTRVGNTTTSGTFGGLHMVHPHACGEYAVLPIIHERQGGSSPRVWGIRKHFFLLGKRDRFIPTRVGNTKGKT